MWRGRLGGCCSVGSIPFEFRTGGRGGFFLFLFFACVRSQCQKKKDVGISEAISSALYNTAALYYLHICPLEVFERGEGVIGESL